MRKVVLVELFLVLMKREMLIKLVRGLISVVTALRACFDLLVSVV